VRELQTKVTQVVRVMRQVVAEAEAVLVLLVLQHRAEITAGREAQVRLHGLLQRLHIMQVVAVAVLTEHQQAQVLVRVV
jgi:hypothetical protein